MVTPSQIKAVRQQLGESQTEFAKRFGVDQSTVHRWESEGLPTQGVTAMAVARIIADIKAERVAP